LIDAIRAAPINGAVPLKFWSAKADLPTGSIPPVKVCFLIGTISCTPMLCMTFYTKQFLSRLIPSYVLTNREMNNILIIRKIVLKYSAKNLAISLKINIFVV
jgi:hypothetical protein